MCGVLQPFNRRGENHAVAHLEELESPAVGDPLGVNHVLVPTEIFNRQRIPSYPRVTCVPDQSLNVRPGLVLRGGDQFGSEPWRMHAVVPGRPTPDGFGDLRREGQGRLEHVYRGRGTGDRPHEGEIPCPVGEVGHGERPGVGVFGPETRVGLSAVGQCRAERLVSEVEGEDCVGDRLGGGD